MSVLNSLPTDEILARGAITAADVLRLRRAVHQDGVVSIHEADALFDINKRCTKKDDGWSEFFIEALTEFIVFQERPQGYLTSANAGWLMSHISRDGRVASRTELELLVNVLDKARWTPVSLVKFALDQVRYAVVKGRGPLRDGTGIAAGAITTAEVELLRRILYAFGGDGCVAVTKDEADVLFDIDEAVAEAPPNPAWTDLFVKAIANVIMASSGYRTPTREEALRQESALINPDQQTSMLAFLLSMVRSNLDSVKDAYHDQTPEERALARLEHQRIEIITNEVITEAEASWLSGRLCHDGRLSPSETALVAYIKQESPKIHPVLIEAVDRLGHAA